MQGFDMGAAWNNAVAFLRDNLQMLLMLIGGTVLVGTIIQLLLGGEMAQQQAAQIGALTEVMRGGDPQAALQTLAGAQGGAGAGFAALLAGLLTSAGTFAAYRLGLNPGDDTPPTAIGYGIMATIMFFIAAMVVGLGIGLIIVIPIVLLGVGAAASGGSGGALAGLGIFGLLFGLVLLVLFVWIFTRLSVMQPVMAAARSLNPIYGAQTSWALTKGKSLMIFLYILLTSIAIFVISAIVAGVLGVVTGILGSFIGTLLLAIVLTIPLSILGVGITAGIYRTIVPDNRADVFS